MRWRGYLAFLLVVYVIPCPPPWGLRRVWLWLLPYAGQYEYHSTAPKP
jgi:hypothetical protein